MAVVPGETALLSARDCFGGRYRDSPRNDVQGGDVGGSRSVRHWWCVKEALAGFVP